MFNRKDDLTKELEQYYADREDHSSHSVLQEIQEAEKPQLQPQLRYFPEK